MLKLAGVFTVLSTIGVAVLHRDEMAASVKQADLDSADSVDDSSSDDSEHKVSYRGENDSSNSLAWGLLDMSRSAVISTIESTHPNWVGSAPRTGVDTACYRETHIAKVCPIGFERKLGTCWAQCPLEYPVECGLQCIRQNDDCTLEMLSKTTVVVRSALSLATFGVYGAVEKMAKGVRLAVSCGKEVANLVRALTKYVRNIQTTNTQNTTDYVMTMLYQTDNVVYDIPITIMACRGIKVSPGMKFDDRVVNTIGLMLKEVVAHKEAILSSWKSFMDFMRKIELDDVLDDMKEDEISSLQSALASNLTCAHDMRRLVDRAWLTVAYLRKQDPDISKDDVRVILSKSNLMHHVVPIVTNNCMEELINGSDESTAYTTRDMLRRTFGGIVDDLVSSGESNNGTLLPATDFMYTATDKALLFTAIWDPTNVLGVVSEYFQTICGPTELIGEVDDGSASDALGLSIVDKAFRNSTGTWTKKGKGTVTITFQSKDVEKVKVNIVSGGNDIGKIKVKPGATVTWTSSVKALEGKTLYLDRWRSGFLGIRGSGGGSLLLWVPRSRQGGDLELTAILNAT
ncbi:unnamed protein product [Hyaloperonospora brassicae]|uniref:RxLR effector candidate protein n=1 Tax=Hyaloperonospora brassicae TaxID=162125 RepID=A0AAV0T5R0_HYABA|nr:unnamed protein product [Hyaloperonospora brassicae]